MFIAFDGLDGSGKTTMLKAFVEKLQEILKSNDINDVKVITTREPGGTPLAEAMRNLLFSDLGAQATVETQALMVSAARRDHTVKLIIPNLQQGNVVVTDRFHASTLAFQGTGEEIYDIIPHGLEGGIQPDLWVFMDATPEVCMERINKRLNKDGDQEQNHFDTAKVETINKRYAIYREFFNRQKEINSSSVEIINADKSEEDVMRQIYHIAFVVGRYIYDKHVAKAELSNN